MDKPVPPPPEIKKIIAKFWATANKVRGSGESPLHAFLKQQTTPADPAALNTVAQIFGEWFTPHPVLLFAKYLMAIRKPQSILDPSAGNGILLASLAGESEAKGVGLIQNPSELEKAKLLGTGPEVEWRLGNPFQLLDRISESFDAVIGNLPFGMQREALRVSSDGTVIEADDEKGRLILLLSALRLAPNGIGLFVVSNSFFYRSNENSVRHVLPRLGFRFSGCLSIPPGAFRPLAAIGGILLAIERGDSKKVFVGELSGDEERSELLAKNFADSIDGADLSLGKLIDLNNFREYPQLEEENRVSKMAAEFGAPRVALKSIASEFNLTKTDAFPERANCVYLPLIGTSQAVTELGAGTIKPHNYVQVVLNDSVADARYVAGFFNTPLGRTIRKSLCSGSYIPKITKASLQEASIYLPAREVQVQTISGATVLANASSHIRELEAKLWAQPKQIGNILASVNALSKKDSLPEWLDHLPFPLASILWTYHASGADPKARYEHLLHFFEALAEFMATVYLSGFSTQPGAFEAERHNLFSALEQAKVTVAHGTFGTWKTVVEYLGKRARHLLNGQPSDYDICSGLFCCGNDEVLEMLFSKSLVSIVQETNANRNQWTGHGGIVGIQAAEERHAGLLATVAKLRDVFGTIWDSFELVRPISCRVRSGIFENEVDRLLGPRVPFERVQRKTSQPLDSDSLYLLPVHEARALKLMPLVKIMPAPRTAQNACYFYNRTQKDQQIRFVSYHFEHEAEVVDKFADTLEILHLISGSQA
jgi:hypothetical protein